MAGGKNSQEGFTCGKCWNWTLQLLVWGCLIWFVLGFAVNVDAGAGIYIPFIVIYVTYWINMFCSATFSFLTHQKGGNSIYSYMGSLFYTPAFVDFHIQCYHYETRTHHYKDSNGRDQWRTDTHRVNTHSETYSFKYMTWRDVSGPFLLKTDGFKGDANQALVKLKVLFDIEFANDGTLLDFEAQKNYFISRNRFRDTHYDFTQTNRLNGYSEYNLVNIGDQPPSSVGVCWLIMSTFLCLLEFYKIHVDSFCIHQDFKILKIVSTRTNLYIPENFQPYEQRLPRIVVLTNNITFNDPSRLGEVTVVPELPSLEDITPDSEKANLNTGISGGQYQPPISNQSTGMTLSTNPVYVNNQANQQTNVNSNMGVSSPAKDQLNNSGNNMNVNIQVQNANSSFEIKHKGEDANTGAGYGYQNN